jgi:hypothetical protein
MSSKAQVLFYERKLINLTSSKFRISALQKRIAKKIQRQTTDWGKCLQSIYLKKDLYLKYTRSSCNLRQLNNNKTGKSLNRFHHRRYTGGSKGY